MSMETMARISNYNNNGGSKNNVRLDKSLHKSRSLPAVSRKNSTLRAASYDRQRRRCMTGQEMDRHVGGGLPRINADLSRHRPSLPPGSNHASPTGVDLRSFPGIMHSHHRHRFSVRFFSCWRGLDVCSPNKFGVLEYLQ